MQEILIDRGEFVLEDLVQELDGDRVTLKGGMGLGARGYSAASDSASRL